MRERTAGRPTLRWRRAADYANDANLLPGASAPDAATAKLPAGIDSERIKPSRLTPFEMHAAPEERKFIELFHPHHTSNQAASVETLVP